MDDVIVVSSDESDDVEDVTPSTCRSIFGTAAYASALSDALRSALGTASPPKKKRSPKKKKLTSKRSRNVMEREVTTTGGTTGDSTASGATTPAASPTRTPPVGVKLTSRKSTTERKRPVVRQVIEPQSTVSDVVDLLSSSSEGGEKKAMIETSEDEKMMLSELARPTSSAKVKVTTGTTDSPVRKRMRLRRNDTPKFAVGEEKKEKTKLQRSKVVGRTTQSPLSMMKKRIRRTIGSIGDDSCSSSDESLSGQTSSGMESLSSLSPPRSMISNNTTKSLGGMRARQVTAPGTSRKSAPNISVGSMMDLWSSSSDESCSRSVNYTKRTVESARAALISPAESMITSGPNSRSASPTESESDVVTRKSEQSPQGGPRSETSTRDPLPSGSPSKRGENNNSVAEDAGKLRHLPDPLVGSSSARCEEVRIHEPGLSLNKSGSSHSVGSTTNIADATSSSQSAGTVMMDLCSSSDESVPAADYVNPARDSGDKVNSSSSRVSSFPDTWQATGKSSNRESAQATHVAPTSGSRSRRLNDSSARTRTHWKGPIPVNLLYDESIRPFENVVEQPFTHFDTSGELEHKCAFLLTFGQSGRMASSTYTLEASDESGPLDKDATDQQVRSVLEHVIPLIRKCNVKRSDVVLSESRLHVSKNIAALAKHRASLLDIIYRKQATSDKRRMDAKSKRAMSRLTTASRGETSRIFLYQGDVELDERRIGLLAKNLVMPKFQPLCRAVSCVTLTRNFRVDDDPFLSYRPAVSKDLSDQDSQVGLKWCDAKRNGEFGLSSTAVDDEVTEYAMRAVVATCGDSDPVFESLKKVGGLSQPYEDYIALKKLHDTTDLTQRRVMEAMRIASSLKREGVEGTCLLERHAALKSMSEKSLSERLAPLLVSFDSHTVRWQGERIKQPTAPAMRALNVCRTNDYDFMVETYRAFFCRICYCYDCQEHGIEQPQPRRRVDPAYPRLNSQTENIHYADEDTCATEDDVPESESDDSASESTEQSENEQRRRSSRSLTVIATTATSNWELQEQQRGNRPRRRRQRALPKRDESEYLDFSHIEMLEHQLHKLSMETEPCSERCWKSKNYMSEVEDDATIVMIEKLVRIFGSNSCAISTVMNALPCNAVHNVLVKLSINAPSGDSVVNGRGRRNKTGRRGHGTRNHEVFDRTRNHREVDHSNNHAYEPCNHDGPCSSTKCGCIRRDHNCEKACSCPRDCRNRFRGCNCAFGACRTAGCPCVAAGRECDPDLCRSCGASEVALLPFLDTLQNQNSSGMVCSATINALGNRQPGGVSPRQWSGRPVTCANVHLQRGARQKIAIGASGTHGWGAYATTSIRGGDFICEYPGELISQDEAERRGQVYDKVATSYLFDLNEDAVVDAIRMGNKSRFINHEPSHPNCHAKVVRVGAEHRITIWAKRDILRGEELFFDYGFKPECAPAWSRVEPSKHPVDRECDQ